MIQKPRLKSYLSVFPLDTTTWGLRGGLDELSRVRLRDERAMRTFAAVLPFLNGQHQIESILGEVERQGIHRDAALQLIEQLAAASLIEEADSFGLSDEELVTFEQQLAFFSRFSSEGGAKYQKKVRESCVAVIGDGPLAARLRRQLEEGGVGRVLEVHLRRSAPTGANATNGDPAAPIVDELERHLAAVNALQPPPDLTFLTQEAHDPFACEALDAFSKSRRAAWMLVRALDPHEGWVGPLFIPGEGACYLSLEARFRSNVVFYREYQAFYDHLRTKASASEPCGGLHSFFELLSAIAVTEAMKHLSGSSIPQLLSRFLTINLMTWELEAHDVLVVPRLGLETSKQPIAFPWKEVPYDATEEQRENELVSRRG